jgi:hypothetical protein
MKKFLTVLLATLTTAVISQAAFADSATFNYLLTEGAITAAGTLTGSSVAGSPNEFDITSGTISLTGSTMNRTGELASVPANGIFIPVGAQSCLGVCRA